MTPTNPNKEQEFISWWQKNKQELYMCDSLRLCASDEFEQVNGQRTAYSASTMHPRDGERG